MKKTYLSVAIVCLLGGSMLFSSCIGSFSLTNKLLAWNKTVGNKFVNELVFFAFWVLPVYEVSALADVLVGVENPSGKLPVTFYRSTEQLPDFEDYDHLAEKFIRSVELRTSAGANYTVPICHNPSHPQGSASLYGRVQFDNTADLRLSDFTANTVNGATLGDCTSLWA